MAQNAQIVRQSPPTTDKFMAGDIMTWWAHGSPLKAIAIREAWIDKWVEYNGKVTYSNYHTKKED